MNKKELAHKVAEVVGFEITKKEAEEFVNATLEAIEESLVKGEDVKLVGFGNFEIRERAARIGRNPSTGEEIEIPASKCVGFKVGKKLKDAVKNG